MIELDLTRAKQLMQDVATVLSKLLGGSATKSTPASDVTKPQTFEEIQSIVSSINNGVGHGR